MWTGDSRVDICAEGYQNAIVTECDSDNQTYVFRYRNDNPSQSVVFVISLLGKHTAGIYTVYRDPALVSDHSL